MKRIQYLLTILITLAWASCNTKHNTIEDHWNDAMEQVEDLADATEDAVDDAADFVEKRKQIAMPLIQAEQQLVQTKQNVMFANNRMVT